MLISLEQLLEIINDEPPKRFRIKFQRLTTSRHSNEKKGQIVEHICRTGMKEYSGNAFSGLGWNSGRLLVAWSEKAFEEEMKSNGGQEAWARMNAWRRINISTIKEIELLD